MSRQVSLGSVGEYQAEKTIFRQEGEQEENRIYQSGRHLEQRASSRERDKEYGSFACFYNQGTKEWARQLASPLLIG